MVEKFLNGRVQLYGGDSRDALKTIPDNSIDSIVTDPPYALVSIVKRFANSPRSENTENTENPYGRTGRGFMGQRWDTGETAFASEFWAECLRVLKPGGHLVSCGGTRTYHRMACAIEDAGFEIRDMIGWLYGSGFPKSHDVSKGIDRAAGVERRVVAQGAPVKRMIPGADQNKDGWEKNNGREYVPTVTAAATDAAAQWEGWGTALKPAQEPICLARKPLSEKTVAANVLRWRTGALNIGACRIGTADELRSGAGGLWSHYRDGEPSAERRYQNDGSTNFALKPGPRGGAPEGRWPANVAHDGSDEVVGAFPDAPGALYGVGPQYGAKDSVNCYGDFGPREQFDPRGDAGSAARFFYAAKADGDDRLGSKHPTVKPVDLMQWLCRLVTPPGGTVLDPFAGTGTTAEAAYREGMSAVVVEREDEYQGDIRRRMALVLAGPDERARESIKARTKDQPIDAGPLFAAIPSDFL